ncbi:hypothetical protein BDM02DRAFT_3154834 [Thelephora ganbajun]|uniref:Uncharacterized protein n=1 Tax=Thelephora ganbajun TaxID=370292 RepID=A0ACB6ZM93_THEGA|nr:hypothetical protein BDM02DRAFT_3154834 [Thelephora ganbajun]
MAQQTLNRDAFNKRASVLAVSIPAEKVSLFLKSQELKGSIINIPKTKSVVRDPSSPDKRLVLFRVPELADLCEPAQSFLKLHDVATTTHDIDLDYNFWNADEILGAVLPEELLNGAPSGFAATGHIAHLNLNDEYLPYKYIIGQVILDKNKGVKTVVNKLNSIDTKFRFFKMELLAGEPNYVVEHHESSCVFTFDFTQVYWNSRLHTEHDRLVQLFSPDDVIVDVFAGVGPFALPAAKKGCGVLANDLNPESYKWLSRNIGTNKVQHLARSFEEDGRDFIKAAAGRVWGDPFPEFTPKISKSQAKKEKRVLVSGGSRDPTLTSASESAPVSSVPVPQPKSRRQISHFVMNLPDSAIEFLDAFRGILVEPELRGAYEGKMPMVHCHCFTREVEDQTRAERDIKQRVEEKLGHALTDSMAFHLVRSVAPGKDMYCISFRLPRDVAFAKQ